jgi:membrane-associated protease RseP (regulator of RpoE activity)
METKSDRTTAIALVAGGIALLLGLCLGVLVGGLGGFAVGRLTGERTAERIVPVVPTPRIEELPAVPELPTLPEIPRLMGLSGAWIREVVADSPAEEAGVRVGDVITQVNATPVDADHRLADVIATFEPGAQVTLNIVRGARTLTLEVTLGASATDRGMPFLGVRYMDLPVDRSGEGD